MNPVLAEVIRGTTIESVHRGSACVVDSDGRVLRAWGDVDALICPRSALKPLQALPLIESGAAAAFGVTPEEIALACASHSGEPEHVTRVSAWLGRLGLSVNDLACGTHPPADSRAAEALFRAGSTPCPLHNNCSGKHTGFLCLALHLNAPTAGYVDPTHAVQRQVQAAIGRLCGWDLADAPVVIDGCSAPNYFLPLRALAAGWARLGTIAPVITAMKAHSYLLSGTERPCAALIPVLAGRGVVKVGAEGVFAACLPEQGLGVAVKIDDGAGRAAAPVLAAILARLGGFAEGIDSARFTDLPQKNWVGTLVGRVRAVLPT
jgi:L-asparaginase II